MWVLWDVAPGSGSLSREEPISSVRTDRRCTGACGSCVVYPTLHICWFVSVLARVNGLVYVLTPPQRHASLEPLKSSPNTRTFARIAFDPVSSRSTLNVEGYSYAHLEKHDRAALARTATCIHILVSTAQGCGRPTHVAEQGERERFLLCLPSSASAYGLCAPAGWRLLLIRITEANAPGCVLTPC